MPDYPLVTDYTLETLREIVPIRGGQTIHAKIVCPAYQWSWYLLALSADGIADCLVAGYELERSLVNIEDMLFMRNRYRYLTYTFLDRGFSPRPLAGFMPPLKPVP
jgi:hypothetical protein